MANIPIWPGSSSFFPGNTPFGFYDNDYQFQQDADKVAKFCALRLGYPIENVELQDINFYAAFEEAVTVYGNELYAYSVRDNMLSLEGVSTGSALNHAQITPTMATIVRLSEQYGEEAGVGGNVTWYSGSVEAIPGVQDYDLAEWAVSESITGGIEIKQVFFAPPPAVDELYAPYTALGAGLGGVAPYGASGLGYGPGLNFLMMPLSYNMQLIQQIEMSNQVNFSNYTFQLINNKLRVFPVPSDESSDPETGYRSQIWFNYIKIQDRINSAVDLSASSTVTNPSNAPYNNPTYTQINSIGRSWVFEYTLAISKEMLGLVRNKYSSIPIPGAEVTLNGNELTGQAASEKESLITRLREYFDSTSRQALLERRAAETTARQSELSQVPMTIYIG